MLTAAISAALASPSPLMVCAWLIAVRENRLLLADGIRLDLVGLGRALRTFVGRGLLSRAAIMPSVFLKAQQSAIAAGKSTRVSCTSMHRNAQRCRGLCCIVPRASSATALFFASASVSVTLPNASPSALRDSSARR